MFNEDRAECVDPKDRLIREIYRDLLRIARAMMRRERRDHTLQASALVHEAVMRLLDKKSLMESSDPSHVLAAAVQAMRRSWSTMPGGAKPASEGVAGLASPWTTSSRASMNKELTCSTCTRLSNAWVSHIRTRRRSWNFTSSVDCPSLRSPRL